MVHNRLLTTHTLVPTVYQSWDKELERERVARHRHLHRCTGRRDCGKANDVAEVDSHGAIALGQDRFVRLQVLSDRGRQKSMQQLS